MFSHSSRRLTLNDSINGLSVSFSGGDKPIITLFSYAHLSRTYNPSIMLTTSSYFNEFTAWLPTSGTD